MGPPISFSFSIEAQKFYGFGFAMELPMGEFVAACNRKDVIWFVIGPIEAD